MAQPINHLYTREEYLALEENAEYKSEYYKGEIFKMAGASDNHNTIALNIATELNVAFKRRPCKVYMSDMRLLVQSNGLFTYPDIMGLCEPPVFTPDSDSTLTNPAVIFEILSDSTQSYDRGGKFELYRALPTLQHYILVDQKRIYVESYQKSPDQSWVLRTFTSLEDILLLPAIGVDLALNDVYNKLDFAAQPNQ